MKIPPDMPRLKGFRFPREVIAYAVWAYHRFALSTADVEDQVLSQRWTDTDLSRLARSFRPPGSHRLRMDIRCRVGLS